MIPKIPRLDSTRHKEDTVREEVVVPILKALGYQLDGENRIERGVRLKHPYIMVGSRRFPITLIPDYVLYRHSQPFCILDAKGLKGNIFDGDHVGQAFSYAIHPEIRVQLFALCNGTELAIHHVSKDIPTLRVQLAHLPGYWSSINHFIGTDGAQQALLPKDFQLDYGLLQSKIGDIKKTDCKKILHFFPYFHLGNFRRAYEGRYVSHTSVDLGGEQEYALTVMFDTQRFDQLLTVLPSDLSDALREAMRRWPYHCAVNTPAPLYISISGVLCDEVYTSTTCEFDQYRPIVVTDVHGLSP